MKPDEKNLDDLLERATDENIHEEVDTGDPVGLEALIPAKSAHRLARLGGSEPQLDAVPRRKPKT